MSNSVSASPPEVDELAEEAQLLEKSVPDELGCRRMGVSRVISSAVSGFLLRLFLGVSLLVSSALLLRRRGFGGDGSDGSAMSEGVV